MAGPSQLYSIWLTSMFRRSGCRSQHTHSQFLESSALPGPWASMAGSCQIAGSLPCREASRNSSETSPSSLRLYACSPRGPPWGIPFFCQDVTKLAILVRIWVTCQAFSMYRWGLGVPSKDTRAALVGLDRVSRLQRRMHGAGRSKLRAPSTARATERQLCSASPCLSRITFPSEHHQHLPGLARRKHHQRALPQRMSQVDALQPAGPAGFGESGSQLGRFARLQLPAAPCLAAEGESACSAHCSV